MSFNLNDYIDVKTRITMFHQAFPQGSLQFVFKGVCEHDPDYIWGIAYAYRDQDDVRPGVGTAQELAVGRTNFTKGSTLQNLESSCWGRAIASLGLGIDNSVASKDEVEAVQTQKTGYSVTSASASKAQLDLITKLMPSPEWVADWKASKNITGKINKAEASALIEDLTALKAQEQTVD